MSDLMQTSSIVFDGYAFADAKEQHLQQRLTNHPLTQQPVVTAILFGEDQGSQLYTRLKKEAAERVGIGYNVEDFSVRDDVSVIVKRIQALNQQSEISGIIIQKPWRQTWMNVTGGTAEAFAEWWGVLTSSLAEAKDVDGLHPNTLAAIKQNTWKATGKVLPATCKAVLSILSENNQLKPESHIIILGKSDILGQPLFFELQNQGFQTEMIGSKELQARMEQGRALLDADIVISSTGRQHLITGAMVKPGVVVVDVGEPKPDVEFATVAPKASFITPVPGGVGPVTVVSLLENAIDLVL